MMAGSGEKMLDLIPSATYYLTSLSSNLSTLTWRINFMANKTYRVSFVDNVTASSEEEAYEILLDYLAKCAKYGDATAFSFEETQEEHYQTH